MGIELRPIGFVRTDAGEVPRHWSVSEVEGALVIDEEYREGLKDIEPGQRIVVIFNFHQSPEFAPGLLRQTPPHRGREMGLQHLLARQAQPRRYVRSGGARGRGHGYSR